MKTYCLERTQIIERSLAETFRFFSDAANLGKITPEFLRFKIITPQPIKMQAGVIIDYSLSLFGMPFKWQTLIEKWETERMFVDRQIKGPYALWVHTHTFEALGPDRTLMKDRVDYQIPLGILGELACTIFVRYTLAKIFDYRAETTAKLLAPPSQALTRPEKSMTESRLVIGSGD